LAVGHPTSSTEITVMVLLIQLDLFGILGFFFPIYSLPSWRLPPSLPVI